MGSNNVRELTSANDPIGSNEFLVAMKCGLVDYHFIRLTDNGWYNKSGGYYSGIYIPESDVTKAVWNAIISYNGERIDMLPYYTDEMIYFAVRKDRDKT